MPQTGSGLTTTKGQTWGSGYDPDTETESSLNSTDAPLLKMGGLPWGGDFFNTIRT